MVRFVCFEKLYCLSGQGRKGGKAAEESREDKEPELIANIHFIKITPAKADDKRTNDIDEKRAEREIKRKSPFAENSYKISTDGAKCPTKAYGKNFTHIF